MIHVFHIRLLNFQMKLSINLRRKIQIKFHSKTRPRSFEWDRGCHYTQRLTAASIPCLWVQWQYLSYSKLRGRVLICCRAPNFEKFWFPSRSRKGSVPSYSRMSSVPFPPRNSRNIPALNKNDAISGYFDLKHDNLTVLIKIISINILKTGFKIFNRFNF